MVEDDSIQPPRKPHHRRQQDYELLGGMSVPFLTGDMPWKVRLILVVTFWLGPSVIVATVFLSMWAGWIPSPVTENQKILVRIESKLDNASGEMKREVERSRFTEDSTVRLLLTMCNHAAKSEAQVQECNSYWKR